MGILDGGAEEPKSERCRRDRLQEAVNQRLVIRADRPQKQRRSVSQRDIELILARVFRRLAQRSGR